LQVIKNFLAQQFETSAVVSKHEFNSKLCIILNQILTKLLKTFSFDKEKVNILKSIAKKDSDILFVTNGSAICLKLKSLLNEALYR
jgi:hypothetical protein